MLNYRGEREIIGGDEHVMVILSNQGAECVHKSRGRNLRVGYLPEVTDRPGSNVTFDGRERRHIDGDPMSGKRSRDRGRDSRNHSQNEDGLFHEDLRLMIRIARNTGGVVGRFFLQILQNVSSKFVDTSLQNLIAIPGLLRSCVIRIGNFQVAMPTCHVSSQHENFLSGGWISKEQLHLVLIIHREDRVRLLDHFGSQRSRAVIIQR